MAKLDGTNGLIQQYDYQVLTTAFSYTFAAGTQTLIINPAGTLATGTITMPAAPADGMVIWITTTKQIVALTINGNTGQTLTSGVTSLAPNQSVAYLYRASNTTWYPFETQLAQGSGPAFSAYKSGDQSFSQNTWTKGTFTLEEYDTNSNYDTTNSRFLPTVAGYYQISCNGYLLNSSDSYMQLYRNGASMSPTQFYVNAGFSFTQFHLAFSNLIYLNGSTDYLELWFNSNATSPSLRSSGSHFQGFLARSA
jgi:hypothetical protein